MTLTELVLKFQNIITPIANIETFVFDDLSAINENRNKHYPVFLFKPPNSNIPDWNKPYTIYSIEFFILDLHKQNDTRELKEVWDANSLLAKEVINDIKEDTDNFAILGAVNEERGHFQYNDKLVGNRYTFDLRVFNCNV